MMTMIDDMMGMMITDGNDIKDIWGRGYPKSTRMLQKLLTSTNTSKKCIGLSEHIKVAYGLWQL